MAKIIPEGFGFVARGTRTRREASRALLDAAEAAGIDRQLIRVTQGGYIVPEELIDDVDFESENDDRPSASDNKAAWLAYAVAQGYDESEELTKAELIERYGD